MYVYRKKQKLGRQRLTVTPVASYLDRQLVVVVVGRLAQDVAARQDSQLHLQANTNVPRGRGWGAGAEQAKVASISRAPHFVFESCM